MWYLNMPIIDTSNLPTTTQDQTPSLPVVFHTSTNCPIPTEWLIGAALVGLLVGYAMWGRR